jgi:tetratricopeptide (TPR) repeat protein
MSIIGTNNVGKRNLQEKQAICQRCGRLTTLLEYETKSWFCVVLPLIPLGNRKILNYCTLCSAHQSIRLKDWESYRQRKLRMAVMAYSEDLENPNAAIDAHRTLISFSRPAEALEVEHALTTQFRDDPHVQWYLAGHYQQQGRSELAEQCIRSVLRIGGYDHDDPEYIARLAITKIHWKQLDDAEKLLAPLAQSSPAHYRDAYLLLAQAYQEQGNHAQAFACYQAVRATHPLLVQYPSFRDSVRRSEKAIGVYSSTVPPEPIYRRRGLLVTVAVFLLLVITGSVNFYKTQYRTLHVLNGLSVPIEVVIDGQKKQILPNQHLPLVMAEGEHQGELVAPSELAEHFKFQIHTRWWQRFTHNPAFVLDPARVTILGKFTEISAAHHEGAMRLEGSEYFAGQLYTFFEHIDKAFPPLAGVSFRKRREQTIRKTYLDIIKSSELVGFLTSSNNNLAINTTVDILERHLLTTMSAGA